MTGTRKPISYYRDILWNEDRPIYLAVREPDGYFGKIRMTGWAVWPTFESWTWPGHEGKDITVEVYSRAPMVRLYLNGDMIGEQPTGRKEEYKAVFKVPYQPGELKAVAVDTDGNPVSDRNEGGHTVLKTAGEPYALRVRAEDTSITADGQDLSFISIEVVDKDGNVCPDASNAVTVEMTGKAAGVIAVGNGDVKETGCTADNVHNAWKGRALAVVRASDTSGTVIVKFTSPGLKPARTRISVTF